MLKFVAGYIAALLSVYVAMVILAARRYADVPKVMRQAEAIIRGID